MRILAVSTLLCLTAFAAPAQEAPIDAGPRSDLEVLTQRIAELEARQAELMARIEQLEAMRVLELRTLLDLYEKGGAAAATAADSPAAPTPAAATASDEATEAANGNDGDGDGDGEPAAPAEEQSPAAAFVETAKTKIDEENFPAAIRILNVAIDLEPNNDEAYFYRGVARHLMERYDESMEDFQTAYAVSDKASMRYTCLYNQACVFALTGDLEKCLEYLERSWDAGFQDIVMQMATDQDLDTVRGNTEFRDLLWKLKNP